MKHDSLCNSCATPATCLMHGVCGKFAISSKEAVVELVQDFEGNTIVPIPQSMLDELGWKEGDTLEIFPTAFALKKITVSNGKT